MGRRSCGTRTPYAARLAIVTAALLFAARFTTAAPPPNDDCSAATILSGEGLTFVELAEATDGAGDPIRACTGQVGHQNVWLTYTATVDGSIYVTSLSQVSVYAGTCAAPVEAACLPTGSFVTVPVAAGTSYLIEVSGPPVFPPPLGYLRMFVCGDGVTAVVEQCDDGNGIDGDECTNGCRVASCGDGSVHTGFEQCDDGNQSNTDACTNACAPNVCGDGFVNTGVEECDDGNAVEGDACRNGCVLNVCGDGFVNPATEQCDDGNVVGGDGCESDCYLPSTCGNSVVEGHEGCDDGNAVNGDGCDDDCRRSCPGDLCKCLGAAAQFTVVGGKLTLQAGKLSDGGQTETVPAVIEGSVCGLAGKFSGKLGGDTEIDGDLALTAPFGIAASFKGYKDETNQLVPGVYASGDVATGGGAVKGPQFVSHGGALDTTGLHASVASCAAAAAAVRAASPLLSAAPPTQVLTNVVVEDGDAATLNVGPGAQVLNVDSIVLKGGFDAAQLEVVLDPATTLLILNVAKGVKIGAGSSLTVDNPGEVPVLLNLRDGAKLTLGDEALLDMAVLSATAKLTVPDGAFTSAIYTTQAVKIAGGELASVFECDLP